MPFDLTTYAPIPALAVAALIVLPREERGLRLGAVLYALATTAAFPPHADGLERRPARRARSPGRWLSPRAAAGPAAGKLRVRR